MQGSIGTEELQVQLHDHILIFPPREFIRIARLYNHYQDRGGGTSPADPAAAGPIIYGEITTKDDLTT